MIKRVLSIGLLGLLLFGCKPKNKVQTMEDSTNKMYMLVGTYSSAEEEGIHVYQFDQENGELSRVSGVKGIPSPSYLVVSNDGNFVYSIAEEEGDKAAAHSLSFDKDKGVLNLLNSHPTKGDAPCYIELDPQNRFAVTANYSGGSISVFPINENGKLLPASQVVKFSGSGKDKERQEKPHLHSVIFSPDDKHLFANDLGTDRIYKFNVSHAHSSEFLKEGEPAHFSVEPGSGPRHNCFHPNGKYMYTINELSGKVTAFKYTNGNLESFQSIKSDTLNAQGSADIHITPDGKFLYSSNRLEADGLAIFSVNEETGELTKIGYEITGLHPRNFVISPNGKYLLVASRDDNKIQIFSIDKNTGLLNDTKKDVELSKPVCLKFVE